MLNQIKTSDNMKELKIEVNLKYEVDFLPSNRHKYRRSQIEQETITVGIPQLEPDEAPIAFRVKSHSKTENYYHYKGQLWRKIMWHEKYHGKNGYYPIKELIWYVKHTAEKLPYYCDGGRVRIEPHEEIHGKEQQMKVLQDYANGYLIIGKHICSPIGEPMYNIQTFGLGHNHGGTSMFVQNWYNSNIPNTSYFPANKREEAIAYGKRIAKGRGDTESIRTIGKYCNIEIFIPELVTRNPMDEHGEGDSFINSLNKITQNAGSHFEAGLLAIALTAKELNK